MQQLTGESDVAIVGAGIEKEDHGPFRATVTYRAVYEEMERFIAKKQTETWIERLKAQNGGA